MVLVLGESRREEMVSMERVKPAKMLMVRSRVMMSEMMTEEGEEGGLLLELSVDGGGMMTLSGWLMGAWWGEGFSDEEMRLRDWDRRSWERAEGAWMVMVSTSRRFADLIAWIDISVYNLDVLWGMSR